MSISDVFEDVKLLPDLSGQREYDKLVGLDEVKDRLEKETLLLIDPAQLDDWNRKFYNGKLTAIEYFKSRPPLFILAGDVGTGKTAIARNFGNKVAKLTNVRIELYVLSLNARGKGAVGEMTRLISGAFQQVRTLFQKSKNSSGKYGRGVIFLIDEADALAQSREATQMHHEDRAGVNALIRGIDEIASERLPIAVVMCTNRLDAIDPAVRRRAAAIFEFARPNALQRLAVLKSALDGSAISDTALKQLVEATGVTGDQKIGYTYSDLTQRLIPALVLDAFPATSITESRALEVAKQTHPTPPFKEYSVGCVSGGENG